MGVLTPTHLEDLDVPDATFACPDLTTFARLDELGLEAWQAAGWTAHVLDDKLATVQGQPWSVVVAGGLGLTLKNEGE